MAYRQVWALPLSRIESFFQGQSDIRPDGPGRYLCGSCEITLTALPPRPLGAFSFPQTQVACSGPEPEEAAFRRRFALQFLSAGG